MLKERLWDNELAFFFGLLFSKTMLPLFMHPRPKMNHK